MSDLGIALKGLRTANGLTLRTVAETTGYSNPYLSQIETGKVRKPSPDVLHALARLYGLSHWHLMELAGYKIEDVLKQSNPQKAAIAKLTPEEEAKVMDYIRFLHFRRGK
jgi:HTH-type transcriptional regulator, competence development regulator